MVVCLTLHENPAADDETLAHEILCALKRFWRSEWAYAARCVSLEPPPSSDEEEQSDTWGFAPTEWDKGAELQRMAVREAVGRLPAEERFIVVRLFWEEARAEEVAKELGISRQAVHKRLQRILRKLREQLG